MYTHIGNGIILKTKDIIGIFDINTIQTSRDNKRILIDIVKFEQGDTLNKSNSTSNGQSFNIENNSMILMAGEGNESKYELSKIAVSTLRNRLEKSIFN